jgi:hypothetical protein
VQAEERRSSERRIKDLETRLTTAAAAKARDDEEHTAHRKVLIGASSV